VFFLPPEIFALFLRGGFFFGARNFPTPPQIFLREKPLLPPPPLLWGIKWGPPLKVPLSSPFLNYTPLLRDGVKDWCFQLVFFLLAPLFPLRKLGFFFKNPHPNSSFFIPGIYPT